MSKTGSQIHNIGKIPVNASVLIFRAKFWSLPCILENFGENFGKCAFPSIDQVTGGMAICVRFRQFFIEGANICVLESKSPFRDTNCRFQDDLFSAFFSRV